jgi:hypothetical protein
MSQDSEAKMTRNEELPWLKAFTYQTIDEDTFEYTGIFLRF